MIDLQLIKDSLPLLLRGTIVTLEIASLAAIIGICLGTLLGIAQTGKSRFLRWLVALYVTVVRGTPMLIQITFAFYVLPELGINISAFWVSVTAIGLNSAAYVSQIIKTGIRSIGKGQIEAGLVLGLTNAQIIYYILLPQAFRVVTPALGNEFITLIKDSSLASVIGVVELTREGSFIRSRTFDAFSIFTAVALIYLVLTTSLSMAVHWFEKRMNHHVKN